MPTSITDAAGRPDGDPDFDPRDVVTPHAFEVDAALLNTPLAEPWRRLAALLIDLSIAGVIANVAGGLVGVLVAYVFYRVATRAELESRWKRWGRGVLVALGAAILFGVSIALVEDVEEWGAAGPSLTAVVPGVQPDTSGGPPAEAALPPDTLDRDGIEEMLDRQGPTDAPRSEQERALLRRPTGPGSAPLVAVVGLSRLITGRGIF